MEVSSRILQTSSEGASMNVELPMWRTASEAAMLVVERVEFVWSDGRGRAAIVRVDRIEGLLTAS